MIEIILLSILVVGVAGTATILARKMPVARRTAVTSIELNAANFSQAAKGWCAARIKKMPYFRDFNWMDFLQKMLMRGRVLVLKTENKINDYMLRLRQKAETEKQKDGQVLDNYWHDLKTIVKTKKPERHQNAPEIEETEIKEAEIETVPGLKIKSVYPQAVQNEAQAAEGEVQPAVSRVVMPEDVAQQNQPQSHKKKRSAKKRKLRDPFKW